MSLKLEGSLRRERRFLHQTREAIATVASQAAESLRSQTPEGNINRWPYHPNPNRHPNIQALLTTYPVPIPGGEHTLDGYDTMTVSDTRAHANLNILHSPTRQTDIVVWYHPPIPDGSGLDSMAEITSIGDARRFQTVNWPYRRRNLRQVRLGLPPTTDADLRRRSKEGLVIAEFTVDALSQIHGIEVASAGKLTALREEIDARRKNDEVALTPEIAALIPLRARLAL